MLDSEWLLKQKYEQLVNQFYSDLYSYAYWLIGDKHIAEDVVQETYLRAWQSIGQLNDIKAAKGWLITILRRENFRRFQRKQLQLVDIDDVSVIDEAIDNEQFFKKEELQRAILMLAPEYREPLMLQIIAGFSGEEISNLLKLNKNTVLTRLFRARKLLTSSMNASLANQKACNV